MPRKMFIDFENAQQEIEYTSEEEKENKRKEEEKIERESQKKEEKKIRKKEMKKELEKKTESKKPIKKELKRENRPEKLDLNVIDFGKFKGQSYNDIKGNEKYVNYLKRTQGKFRTPQIEKFLEWNSKN